MRSAENHPYRGTPGYVARKLPTKYQPAGPKVYRVFRFGRYEMRPLKYKSNGDRECWRRRRQMAKLQSAA